MGTVKAAAVMTAARYENTSCRNYIERALKKLQIPLTVSGGVYYGQAMQKMFEQLVETDCDYIVTVDGDSFFTSDHLARLLSLIHQEEQIDAIAPMQVRRGKPTLLGTVHGGVDVGDDARQVEWNGYPLKAKTAHFGLTVIDIAKLRNVKKPWFAATPNAEGMWEGDKVDDDVHFWLQWEKAGNTVYIDPGCRIGHMEEMIACHDEQMQPTHMYPADWMVANGG
jgi:hypothetical protein